ncbi:hypothetical protein LCGC14_0358210 [marine sediment metagenome]|uniref:Uncharacterized protein n=1 Tax=marine sediment metagenome TaxID=412755 RepID=A0A0F9T8Y1_9ZZZZ
MKARIYGFDEVDRPEEVAAVLTGLRQEFVNEVEALRTELAGCVRQKPKKPKKPKKGFAMKKVLTSIVIASLLFVSVTHGQFIKSDINYDIASNPESLSQWLRDVVASGTFEYTPIAAPTNNDIIEGKVYYDLTAKTLFVSKNGTTWTEIETGSSVSLDAAYNVGSTIDVDTASVIFDNDVADNTVLLALTQDDSTNDPDAMTITMGAGHTGTGLTIDSQPSGTDIAGDNWSVNQAGLLTSVGLTSTGGITTGIDGTGVDNIFYGETVGSNLTWDQNGDTNGSLILTGSSQTITGINNGGNLLTITGIDTGGNSDTVLVAHQGSGDALQITTGEADSGGINVIAAASGTVPLIIVDGSTNNIDLADDKGQILIQADDPYIHTGATALMILDSSTPIASGEGFLARFVHSGSATATATAVEIEVPATQPALAVNGITAINGQDAAGDTLFQVVGVGASGDADAMSISNTGAGDSLQISPGETDTGGLNIVAVASGTVPLAILDGSTNNIDLANDKGQLLIQADDPYIHTGASAIVVLDSSTPIASGEGFLARFIHSGSATASATAVEIEVPATQPALAVNGLTTFTQQDNSGGTMLSVVGVAAGDDQDAVLISLTGAGNALQITPGETDTGGINITAFAASTVSMVTLDGASNNWDGADNIGQLTLTQDDAVVNTGATQLMVHNTGTTIAAAEGFLARFVQDTGAAVTDAYAVEIEVTATTPNLRLNGQMTIAGQGATDGVLLDITSADTDDDTVQLVGVGTADVLQVTPNATTATGIHIVGVASTTASLQKVIGDAGAGWVGAASTGMVHLTNDGTAAATTATMLRIASSGTNISGQEGIALNMVDTSTSGGGTEYVMHIDSTNNEAIHVDSGIVVIDETLSAALGLQSGVGETLTTAGAEGAGQQVNDGIRFGNVTGTTGVTEFITLPDNPPMGTKVTIFCNAGGNFEIRTLTAGNDTINNVDTSDGGTEYLATDTDVIVFTYHITDGWIGVSYTNLGAVRTAVIPDA